MENQRFLIICPNGKLIIHGSLEDERNNPDALIINYFYLDHLVEKFYIGEFQDKIERLLEDYNLDNKDELIDIIELYALRKYYELCKIDESI